MGQTKTPSPPTLFTNSLLENYQVQQNRRRLPLRVSVVMLALDWRFLPILHHGRSGTIAGYATVPGEGQDVSQAWPGPTTADSQRQPETPLILKKALTGN